MNGGDSTVVTMKSERSRSESTIRFTAMSRSPITEMFAVSVVSQPGSTHVYVSHSGSDSSPGAFGSSLGPPGTDSPQARTASAKSTDVPGAPARLRRRPLRVLGRVEAVGRSDSPASRLIDAKKATFRL